MANTYPTSLNSYTGTETLSVAGHANEHNALETKLGTGSSTSTNNTVLRGNGTGTSTWAQAVLTTDVTGTLPVANGGTGVATITSGNILVGAGTSAITSVDSSGTGNVVRVAGATLTTPTLGVATATSLNGLTISTTTGTLTLANSSTLATSGGNSITLTSTGSTNVTLPTTGTLSAIAGTETLSNKRITKRVVTVTQSATPTINTDSTDVAYITGLAQAITSMTTNLSGTPVNGDSLIISITDDGTARAITWGTKFESSGLVTLPTTTVLSTRLDVGFLYNIATSKWRCVAIA